MSERKLSAEQERKKAELFKEFQERVMQIPESQGPHNILDGGGGRFHDLGVEFQRRLREIVDGLEDN